MLETMGKLLTNYWFLFAKGTGYTLLLSGITVFFSSIIGSLFAIARMSNWKIGNVRPLHTLVSAYVEVIRGTPMLVQLYFFYFFLPRIVPQLDLSAFTCIAIACIVNSVAYVAEIIRAGIESVDKGQMEAARSLGLTYGTSMKCVILPQAFRVMIPSIINQFIITLKDTSILAVIGYPELTNMGKTISGNTFKSLETWAIVGIMYMIVIITLSRVAKVIERKIKIENRA